MLIELKHVSKSFGTEGESAFHRVLDGLDLHLQEGESKAILGPSGSGKTTLLNIAGALDHPDKGQVIFRGTDLLSRSAKALDQYRNQEIGFVFQFHHLLPQCTLLENVLIPTLPSGSDRSEKRDYAEALLRRVGIWEHRDKRPGRMSGGECQRAAVVRAMINRPSLLLADEPTGALDGKNVEMLADLLQQLSEEEQLAILMVTHSEALASRMGAVYLLRDGKLIQHR